MRNLCNSADKQKSKEQLSNKAFAALRLAERAMHKYAASLPLGEEREKAFVIYENVRTAAVRPAPEPFN